MLPLAVAGAAGAAVCAWWATGTRPFTLSAYLAVGVPVVLVGAGALGQSASSPVPTDPPTLGGGLWDTSPWIVILALAVGLECAALALGGQSTDVPTLSTVVDHALGRHALRFLLFCGWLAVGFAPLVWGRSRRRSRAD
jgi:hypothetical protein